MPPVIYLLPVYELRFWAVGDSGDSGSAIRVQFRIHRADRKAGEAPGVGMKNSSWALFGGRVGRASGGDSYGLGGGIPYPFFLRLMSAMACSARQKV